MFRAIAFLILFVVSSLSWAGSPPDLIFYGDFEPPSAATGTLATDSPCNLSSGSTTCTTNGSWYTKNSPVACVWLTNPYQLVACDGSGEGTFSWSFTETTGTTFELRSHRIFPTTDPQWPNPTGIIARSKLLDTRVFKAVAPCTITVPAGGNIGAAISGSTGPQTICLTAGTYNLSVGFEVRSDIALRGLGATPQATVLNAASNLVGHMIQIDDSAHDVVLENFKIVSNGANQSSIDGVGIGMTNASNVAIRNIDVSNTYRMNIAIGSSSNVTVANTTFSLMGFEAPAAVGAIWINRSDNIVFESNSVTGRNNGPGGDGGVDCYASSDVIIRNNTVLNAGESAIYTTLNSEPNSFACKNVIITDNTINHSWEWGIDMRGLDGALIRRNNIQNCRFPAMSIWDSANSQVLDNTMNNNNQAPVPGACQGINRQGSQTNMTYSGNTGNGTTLCNYVP